MRKAPLTVRALELKVPPVALVLMVAALMWLVSRAAPSLDFLPPARPFIAGSLAAAGVIVSLLGVLSFARAGTSVNPTRPEVSSSLVLSGVYARTRNPMYLGFLLVLVAWAVILGNALAAPFPPGFILYMNRFQIEPEERALQIRFGEVFADYRSRVRRWL